MSVPSGGGGPSDGVVRNSALSFLASAQPAAAEGGDAQESTEMHQAERQMPAGLKALCEVYSRLYPDQPNPLQVTTRLKYWLGGYDPLDYISMYWNPGKPEEHIPPHWHYVSFGLSDLHGDGRVHYADGAVSGRGFELTFRLAAESAPSAPAGAAPAAPAPPPLWPAALLQALARYIFTTGNSFMAGDHVSWHAALDGLPRSRLRHLLVTHEPQLCAAHTPHGTVAFLQMVGCTGRELRAAQRTSGFKVLELIAEDPNCGGAWLVTRGGRRVSARGLRVRPRASPRAAPAPPADLAGVNARLRWEPWHTSEEAAASATVTPEELSLSVEREIKDTLRRGLRSIHTDRSGPEGHTGMSTDSFEMSSMERALPHIPMQGSWSGADSVEYLDGVHLILNPEGASLLPLAIDGRVSHGRHFTWRGAGGAGGGAAVTVLAPAVRGAHATPRAPYAAAGNWLQILIPAALSLEMSGAVSHLSALAETDSESDGECERDSAPLTLPLTFSWPKYKLKISVVPDHELL